MKAFVKRLVCIFMITFLFGCNAYAAEYPEILRVGIYYGSSSVTTLDFETPSGFCTGTVRDRNFVPGCTVTDTALTARVCNASIYGGDGGGAYFIDCGTAADFSDLNARLAEVRASGAEAFGAYVNSVLHVFSGGFKNQNDVQWAVSNFPIAATAVQLPENSVIVFGRQSGKACFVSDGSLGIYNSDYQNVNSSVKISGSAMGSYYGGFDLRCLDSGSLTVVNVVDCENYLVGVVGREMSPSWHVEALKAQAVCARNYAFRRLNYHKQYGFDLCRTTCCQAYSGIPETAANLTAAVSATRGELMFCGGELVQAVYSSSMGAKTESVENVWGTPFSYLVSVDNSYEDTENIYNGKWTKTLTTERVTEIMKNKGYDIGTVTSIEVLEYTSAGSVLKLRVTGTNGSKVFEREACRTVFGEATYSQKYTVVKGGETSYPSVCVTDGKSNSTKSAQGLTILSANGVSALNASDFCVADSKSVKSCKAVSDGDPNSYTFSGEGWGHGVGMSQYGAKGMAEAGISYSDILKHYYTGITIQKVY